MVGIWVPYDDHLLVMIPEGNGRNGTLPRYRMVSRVEIHIVTIKYY